MPSDASPPPRRPWSQLLVALVPMLLLAWRFDFVCDDAYITFRFARNLSEGRGLVYNPGEWVEGYSEFLWALLLAGGQVLGASPLVLSRVLSILSAIVLVHATTRLLSDRVAPTPLASHGAALFLGCLPSLGVWATGGLATMPFAATVVTLFRMVWGAEVSACGWKLGLIAATAALLRADGAWWVALVLGGALLSGLRERDPRRWRPALAGAGISAGVFLAHVGWRMAAYGDWLPSTARAKVGLSGYAAARGGDYVVHFLLTFPGVLLALLFGAAAYSWRERRVGPALMMVLGSAAYAAAVGGDFMAFGRFLVPALPFVVLVLGAGLAGVEERSWKVNAGAAALACVALVLPPAFDVNPVPVRVRAAFSVRHNDGDRSRRRSELEQWANMRYQAREWSALGRALALVARPGDSLVYGAVGAIGWYSRLHLYDRNGLITPSVSALPAQTDPARSPGHDKTVPPEFFADAEPTWMFVTWLPEGPGSWQQGVRRTGNPMLIGWLDQGRLERLPLPAEGHPYPGHHLLVVPGR